MSLRERLRHWMYERRLYDDRPFSETRLRSADTAHICTCRNHIPLRHSAIPRTVPPYDRSCPYHGEVFPW